MTALDQVARLLALPPYLQLRPNAPMEEVADHFGITTKQLEADLWVIYMCGLPQPGYLIEVDMDAVQGQGVINLSNADYLTRPMRFTPAEVAPLILGLQLIRDLADPEVARNVDSALAKLRDAAGEAATDAARLTISVEGSQLPVRDILARAIADRLRVELTYDSESRAERSVREVDPHSISIRGGFAYLEAWSMADPPGWRTFRLDRIVAARATEVAVQDHPGAPQTTPDWADALADARRVRLLLNPQSRWMAEYYAVDEVVELPGGGLEISLPVADPAWLVRLLLQRGEEVEVIEPVEAAAEAAQAAQAALAAYAALDRGQSGRDNR